NDDQPGPICRRHSSTGGEVDQSVLIFMPGMMLSRPGPRKPGQLAPVSASAGVLAATGVGGSATGRSLAFLTTGGSLGISAGAGAAAGSVETWAGSTGSWPPACATSFSS